MKLAESIETNELYTRTNVYAVVYCTNESTTRKPVSGPHFEPQRVCLCTEEIYFDIIFLNNAYNRYKMQLTQQCLLCFSSVVVMAMRFM